MYKIKGSLYSNQKNRKVITKTLNLMEIEPLHDKKHLLYSNKWNKMWLDYFQQQVRPDSPSLEYCSLLSNSYFKNGHPVYFIFP